jgi:ketohexokinase
LAVVKKREIMARILLVGTATLDMVFTLDRHPAEDAEVRAQSLRVCRGGNAANTAVVLAQLGHTCSFFGVLADAPEAAVIDADFVRHGVDFAACPRAPGRSPTSSIYLSGPHRTIVHYRDLPEVTAEQFSRLDIDVFDWVHFEGRNVPQLLSMIARVRKDCPAVKISLELEKPRDGIEAAWNLADVLICSRGYAMHHGFDAPQQFIDWMRGNAPRAIVVAAWGEKGAYARAGQEIFHSLAYPPAEVLDTLGAGDTFNAGFIDGMCMNGNVADAVQIACRLAGEKCGFYGLDGFSMAR